MVLFVSRTFDVFRRGIIEIVPTDQMIDSSRSLTERLRPSEWVLVAYFFYTALLAQFFNLPLLDRVAAIAVPILLFLLVYLDSFNPRRWTSMVRDWAPSPLVLVAYWQLNWFQSPQHVEDLERLWIGWDRTILYDFGLRSGIESMGAVIPWILELSYVLMYAIPPLSVAALYIIRRRDRVDRFLFLFLLGTLSAYALLPYFPSGSPRVEHPLLDQPSIMTIWRRFNIFILSRGDIQTSVFPSGHVTASFSAAFAMMLALPERKWFGRFLMMMAVLISIATVYGRYHYAADGLAGLMLSLMALAVTVMFRRVVGLSDAPIPHAPESEAVPSYPEAS